MNIVEVLREQARAHPEMPAIIDTWRGQRRVTTFGALERASAQAAALLWQRGLRPGDAVLLLQPMSLELYVALLALFRLGLVAELIDPSEGVAYVERCCSLRPPAAFIGSVRAHALRLLSRAVRDIPHKFVIGGWVPGAIAWSHAHELNAWVEDHACPDETPALITFTSGSTGKPKVAERTHGFLLAQHRALERGLDVQPGEVSMTTMPVFVLADLASGCTSFIPDADLRHPGRIDAARVLAQIEALRPARGGASPAFWERIVTCCERQGRRLPHLRRIYLGGAPVYPGLMERLQRVAPAAEIVAVYGATEAEPIARVAFKEFRSGDVALMLGGKGLLAGVPIPDIQVRILPDQWGTPLGPYSREEFATLSLPVGEPGEIVVSGAHVLRGYVDGYGDADAKISVEDVVWHRTGDAGYLDEAGRLWLLGRCAARIADARGTLYPFAVECAAAAFPGVRRAALAASGSRRILLVEPTNSARGVDMASLCAAVAWATIDEVRMLRHIPVDRRHNAKVDYDALRRTVTRM